MKEQVIRELIKNDPSIEKEMCAVATIEELQAVFSKRGVTVSEAELDTLMASTFTTEGELAEDDLEDVAGGISLRQFLFAWKVGGCIGISARRLYDKYKHGNPDYTYSYADFKKMLKDGHLF